jgi:hypothetical protein
MPGIDSFPRADVGGSRATADVFDGVLGVLLQVRDEHPVAALTNTQPAATATRTDRVTTNGMRSSKPTGPPREATAAVALAFNRKRSGQARCIRVIHSSGILHTFRMM